MYIKTLKHSILYFNIKQVSERRKQVSERRKQKGKDDYSVSVIENNIELY